jgi:hypothetical protein
MAEQKKKGPAPKKPAPTTVKKLTLEEKMKTFEGDILQGQYDEKYLKRIGIYERTLLRKMRYWCFKVHFAIVKEKEIPKTIPKGLKEFVESLPGFAGWKNFAHTWDIRGENPFFTVLRLQSVWDEWEAVMRRVAIPLDTPPEQIHERIQALTDEYARKEAKNK